MITIGTDVEVFLGKDGVFASAHDLLPGTKAKPFKVKGGAVQVDGVAAELNTIPSASFKDFKESLYTVVGELGMITPEHTIMEHTTVEIDVMSLPHSVVRLSCETDYDPYKDLTNPSLNEKSPYRSAGGHIHIGGIFEESMKTRDRFLTACRMSRLMDKYVGVYSLLWDKDNYRRTTYGKAGSCRFKKYGMEYRTLSNAWFFNETIMEFVFNNTLKAVNALQKGEDVDTKYADIINSSDVDNLFFYTDKVAKELKGVLK